MDPNSGFRVFYYFRVHFFHRYIGIVTLVIALLCAEKIASDASFTS